MVTSWPPVSETPSAISALVIVEASTWMAAEAPMPTPAPSVFSPVIFFEIELHGRPHLGAGLERRVGGGTGDVGLGIAGGDGDVAVVHDERRTRRDGPQGSWPSRC